ncbi:MAG TPA: hypothetical protein VFT22_10890 [Kofleriaceae bacterium]|nr:hypothetical protein [Kofleriaceae bacterium]
MQWTEVERANIRHYLGFAAIFKQRYPMLENAMTSVLAIADGGTQPDSATQIQIQGWLASLAALETSFDALDQHQGAGQVGKIQVDQVRETARLKMKGRRLVNYISAALSTSPKRDIYSSAPPDSEGVPFDIGSGGY